MTNTVLALSVYLLTNGFGTLTWYESNSTNIIGWNSTCQREAQITFTCTPSNRYQVVYGEYFPVLMPTNYGWTICSPPLYSANTNVMTFVTPFPTNYWEGSQALEQMYFTVRQYNGTGGLFPTNTPTGCHLASWPENRPSECHRVDPTSYPIYTNGSPTLP